MDAWQQNPLLWRSDLQLKWNKSWIQINSDKIVKNHKRRYFVSIGIATVHSWVGRRNETATIAKGHAQNYYNIRPAHLTFGIGKKLKPILYSHFHYYGSFGAGSIWTSLIPKLSRIEAMKSTIGAIRFRLLEKPSREKKSESSSRKSENRNEAKNGQKIGMIPIKSEWMAGLHLW